MPWGEIGSVLLVLVAATVIGNVWFHMVESVLDWIRRRLMKHKAPPAWHPLPPEQEDENDV